VLVGTGDGVARMHRALDAVRNEVFVGPGGEEFQVSFSAGVAEFPGNGLDLQALYRSADEALYNAKDAGRARVFAAQDAPRMLRAAS